MSIPARYRFPAEFERHKATWLLWPTRPDNWRSNAFHGQNDMLVLASLISHFEPVRLGTSQEWVDRIERRLPPGISAIPFVFDDTWVRDTGPTIVVSDGQASPLAVDWRFNSWGGLFDASNRDDAVAGNVAAYEQIDVVHAPIVLEGGSLLSDGRGTLIVTAESVLAENRNPGLTRADAETVFRHFLNIENVVWIEAGLAHDEAGGHIDNVCAFSDARTVLVATTDDSSHPSFRRCQEAAQILRDCVNAQGSPYVIVEVPLPEPATISEIEARGFSDPNGTIKRGGGTPMAASHINFYVCNGAVIVPTFDGGSDDLALDVIGRAFPTRQIIPFRSREFLLGGGAIHCLTREIPHSAA